MMDKVLPDATASPQGPTKSRVLVLSVVALLVAVLLVYWPMLAGHIVFHRDTALWVFPARWFVRQSLRAGELPAWNPYQGLGFPLLADPQYGVFYPPHWLFLLVPDGLVAHLASWLSLAHLIWGGVGMLLLARRLGAGPVGAAVAGLSWALSGHTTSAWAIGPLLLGEAWIPWVARGFLISARREGRAPSAAAVWPMALSLLVGEPFMSAMALFFALVVVLAAGTRNRPPRVALLVTARSGLAWGIAVLIAAVSWLPSVRMLGSTERAQEFSREAAELYSHHPLRLLEMVAPGALGDPTGTYPAGSIVGEPGAAGAPLFFSSYLGVVALAFVLFGLRRRRLPGVLAASALLALFVAFGKHSPVHEIWRRILFPFAHMHSPEKYVVLVVAPLSLLAGLGATSLLAEDKPRLRRLVAFAGGLAAFAALAGVFLPEALIGDARGACLRGLVLLGLLCGLVFALRHFSRKESIAKIVVLAIVGLLVLDLGLPAHRIAGFGSARTLMTVPPAASAVLDDNRGNPAPPRLYRMPNLEANADPLGPDATWRDSQERAIRCLTLNTLNVFGLAVMPGYASAIPDLLSRLGPRTYESLGRSLKLLAMPYVLASDAEVGDIERVVVAKVIAHPLPHGSLLRADGVLPRVYLPNQIRSVRPDEAAQHLSDEAVVSGREVVLLTAGQPMLTPTIEANQTHGCHLVSFSNTRVVAECATPAPNLAVFVEQYDPGWSATVDGTPAPVLAANLVMRAVPIPAGTHRIELSYRSPGLRLALALSTLGLLVFVLTARKRSGY